MALNNRDVVIAGIAIFIAWGFVTHWVPVVRYLGYAFVTGTLLGIAAITAIVLLSSRNTTGVRSRAAKKPQTAAFISPQAWETEKAWLSTSTAYERKSLYPDSFVISESIDSLLDLVLRDFFLSWYRNITISPNFGNGIDKAIRIALGNIKERVRRIDVVEVAVSRFVPIITVHLKEFYEAEHVVRGKKLNRNVTESEELDLAIAAKYRDGKLHQAASLAFSDTKLVQQDYLRKLLVRLMPEVLPGSMISSRAVSVLIKELASCAVFAPIMQLLSDPDTWNQLMEAYVSFF